MHWVKPSAVGALALLPAIEVGFDGGVPVGATTIDVDAGACGGGGEGGGNGGGEGRGAAMSTVVAATVGLEETVTEALARKVVAAAAVTI